MIKVPSARKKLIYMNLASLAELDQKEIDHTRHELNGLFHAVLNELAQSADKVKFPAPVQFNSGSSSLDSLPAKAVVNIVSQLVNEGKLLIAVEPGFTGPLFSVSQCSFMDGSRVRDAWFIGGLFVGNFFARCLADGVEPKAIVKKAISEMVYQDVLMSAQERERAIVPRKANDDLVVIYSGPRLSQP